MSKKASSALIVALLSVGVADIAYLNLVLVPPLLKAESSADRTTIGQTFPIVESDVPEKNIPQGEVLQARAVAANLKNSEEIMSGENGLGELTLAEEEEALAEPTEPSEEEVVSGKPAPPVKGVSAPDGEFTLNHDLKSMALNIEFAFESDVLLPRYHKKLKTLAHTIGDNDFIIDLSGHTDRVGDSQFNEKLSQMRVLSVSRALQSYGINKASLNIAYYGERMPLASKKFNKQRRVELRIRRR